MARKPVKKAPKRKISKSKTFDRILRDTSRKKKSVTNPKFNLKVGSKDDPFWVDPFSIPEGIALHWVLAEVSGVPIPTFLTHAQSLGWKPVSNTASVGGQVLMWAPREMAAKQIDQANKLAMSQPSSMKDMEFVDKTGVVRGIPIISQSFISSSEYLRVPSDAPDIDVEVTVKLRMPPELQDAASALNLPLEIYAQRRMDLYIRGSITGLLLPRRCIALELYEEGKFELVPDGQHWRY